MATGAPLLLIPVSTCGVIETRVSSCRGFGHHVIEFCLVSQSATKHGTGWRVNILSALRQTWATTTQQQRYCSVSFTDRHTSTIKVKHCVITLRQGGDILLCLRLSTTTESTFRSIRILKSHTWMVGSLLVPDWKQQRCGFPDGSLR